MTNTRLAAHPLRPPLPYRGESLPPAHGQSMTPTIAVVGPGAIGTTVAASLHEAGRTPRLYGRTSCERLELRVESGARIIVPGPVQTDPAAAGGVVDLVFLAVKATQLRAAAPWLTSLCDTKTVVCVLQNGVEQEAMVTPLLSGARPVPAIVWFSAQTLADRSVWLRGPARVTVPDEPHSQLVMEALRGTRCTANSVADFTTEAWRKLLLNAATGLTALTGRRRGVFGRADVAEVALAYLRECLEVARAEGAALGDEVPEQIMTQLRCSAADLGSSILVDREAGRPLEWDTRNGVVLRRGRAHGIPTPIGDILVPLLAAVSDGPG